MNLKALNPEQRKAVEYNDGPVMVVAGAGSGKTRVLTYKIAYLVDNGYPPENILALTFTNKAANEMKERIKELIGAKSDALWMGTFHSIFARILRIEAKHLDYRPNFSIYDTDDTQSLVQNIMSNLNIEIESLTTNSIRHRISYLKNHMIMPREFRKKHITLIYR